MPRPITSEEFARWFRKCAPPRVGWPSRIGVANSGGPDSTCLLFLIHRYLENQKGHPLTANPQTVVSLTVDHDLQPSSSAMTDHCAKVARSLGVKHITTKIPWSTPPFPARPQPGDAFENTARNARYYALLQEMITGNIYATAFAHHADDQVETSLMRLGRGSTKVGAAGMRPCRRWGMGISNQETSISYTGYEGMNRYVVRPLLEVGKDRILSTCEANNLDYVVDRTNFQPDITLRNALRDRIQNGASNDQISRPSLLSDIQEKLASIDSIISSFDISLDDGPERLRSTVMAFSEDLQDLDNQVDSILNGCRLPSFPGTFLISARAIAGITDRALRRAIVLRILRYVSFHPWGTLRSEGKRRMESIDTIISRIWNPVPFHRKSWMFVAGAGVLWTPVAVGGNRIKTPDRVFATGLRSDEAFGWLASRQPPMSRAKLEARGLTNTLEVDVTVQLVRALRHWKEKAAPSTVEIMWDCRYLVRFDLEKMPPNLVSQLLLPGSKERIMINSRTRWYWPKVIRVAQDEEQVLHSKISETRSELLPNEEHPENKYTIYWKAETEEVSSNWIGVEWIRSLDAV